MRFDMEYENENFEERRKLRAERRMERARRQKRRYQIVFVVAASILFVCLLAALGTLLIIEHKEKKPDLTEAVVKEEVETIYLAEAEEAAQGLYQSEAEAESELSDGSETEMKFISPGDAAMVLVEQKMQGSDDTELLEAGALTGVAELNTEPDERTEAISEEVDSGFAILISLKDNRVVASRQSRSLMYPASMTKVMTVVTAAEHLRSNDALGEIVQITQAIENYSYSNGCSNVGFSVGERVTVADLFYGTILPSGADAAMSLAEYTAGSQEAFVEMMNEKARELGIGDSTHFVNCVGLYDDNHYSTAADMAVIMNAAMDNPLCREVLSRHIYTTTSTSYHPDGIVLSNLFLRRIEDHQPTGIVLGAKTGFVNQSLNCAVSYGEDDNGDAYICVTGYGHGAWQVIRDHVAIYSKYFGKTGSQEPESTEGTGQEDGQETPAEGEEQATAGEA